MGYWFPALVVVAYIMGARICLWTCRGIFREVLFSLLNIVGIYLCFFYTDPRLQIVFPVYLAIVMGLYVHLRLGWADSGFKLWLVFLAPILVLAAARYLPPAWFVHIGPVGYMVKRHPDFQFASLFLGLSYLAFRCSYLVLEIRNGVVEMPGFWRYLGYCFFVPTMSVGPINPYSNYCRAFANPPPALPAGRAGLRLMVGLIKFKLFGSFLFPLTYDSLLRDGHDHHLIDLIVAVGSYYLYLYCNFSGFCDMAIGAAGLVGVPVKENFDNPFAARNIKNFWNRWHITLSEYMRDVVFSPSAKFLARWLGPAGMNHAVTLPTLGIFLLIGAWHGVGWNYFLFGAIHGVGVIGNHYYTLALKKWLGRDGFKAYLDNPWIHALAVGVTFCYVAVSLFFFANTFPEMKQIWEGLRW